MKVEPPTSNKLYNRVGSVYGRVRSTGYVHSTEEYFSNTIIKPMLAIGTLIGLGIYGYWAFGGDMSKINPFKEELLREQQSIEKVVKE